MKKQSIVVGLMALVGILPMNAQVNFDDYFTPKTMRLDYYHAGDAKSEHFFVDEVIEELPDEEEDEEAELPETELAVDEIIETEDQEDAE